MNTLSAQLPASRLAEFCQRWKIVRLELFGSALRSDFRPESDVDLLATFAPQAGWSLLDHVRMERELATLIGRTVELISRPAIERSRNAVRREHILRTAQPLYVER